MGRFVYASPVRPGKSAVIRRVYEKKRLDKNRDPARKEIGLTGWDCWLQVRPEGNLFIHCLEGEDLDQIFARLREEIDRGQEHALWLRQFYLEVLGKDYRQPEAQPKLDQILDIHCSSVDPKYQRGFALPLLPGREQAHRDYCKECQDCPEYAELLELTKVGRLTKFIQEGSDGDLMVCFQQTGWSDPTQSQPVDDHPAWHRLNEQCRVDTGHPWSLPQLEYLT